MNTSKLNHWLVILGVLLILVGIVDAVGVVQATPSSALSQPVEPPEDFGRAEREDPSASEGDGSGYLPWQALHGQGLQEQGLQEQGLTQPSEQGRTLLDSRLQAELNHSLSPDLQDSAMRLPDPRPAPEPEIPRLLWIPAIDLYTTVIPVDVELVEIDGVEYDQWTAPDEFAAGWHANSAPLGTGNSVLNGHHNIYGEVFRDLVDLKEGDEIILYSDRAAHTYIVEERVIFPERFAKPEQRVQNAELITPTEDERLTLITCWPYESNTHRLVLVARPLQVEE
jgi:LPXTG-site transpeptidase (sortase) family protein